MFNNHYILNSESPIYLRSSYEFALASIKEDVNSANYVNWFKMSEDEYNYLIQELIKNNYILSENSCSTLQNNLDIVLHSLKKDIYTIKYASENIQYNPDVIKFLIQEGYEYDVSTLMKMPISILFDTAIMEYVIYKVYSSGDSVRINFNMANQEIKNRIINLLTKSLKTLPTISNYKNRLQYITESLWKDNRADNINDYANIFGKICAELNFNRDFDDACSNLLFLPKMGEVLENKYQLLIDTMKEYHRLYHSNCKLDELASYRNEISNLAALYISISKEKYKKNIVEDFYEDLKLYFVPRKTNPYIQKKIKEYKQKHEFKRLFQNHDSEIYSMLNNIVDGWSKIIDKDTIRTMIEGFLVNNHSKLYSFMPAPRGYNNYKRYIESSKLIKRLNNKYIKYTDLEVTKYLDIIKYDNDKNIYYYYGPLFTKESVERYNEYEKKKTIFEKLKQQIVLKAKKLEVDEDVTKEELVAIREDIPFNDEYFEFDETISDEIRVRDFLLTCLNNVIINDDVISDDESLSFIENHIISNNLVWSMLIFAFYDSDLIDYEDLNSEKFFEIANNSKEIMRLAKLFNYDVTNYENIMKLNELSNCADDEAIAILGKDIILKLCEYREYTTDQTEEIIDSAIDLVCKMAKRCKSTVPYINGELENYKYALYDSQDSEILLSGINTNACFRIDGNDNDFLYYCALDKNGFVIKIVDEFNNFIARASGFRNGNGVYINQLRTIYDYGGLGYEGDCLSEKEKIIDTFKKACQDMVDTSQNNKYERDKIDFVLVTKSYALADTESNVSKETERKIGNTPMDYQSDDWTEFVNSTDNLQEIVDERDFFSTDYGDYSLICVAHSTRIKDSNEMQLPIKSKNVEALYTRKRSKILIDNPNPEIIDKINRIKGIDSYLNNYYFKSALIPQDSIVFVGDNWFIVYSKGNIIDECLLEYDKSASIEYEAAKRILESSIELDYIPGKKLFLSRKSNF